MKYFKKILYIPFIIGLLALIVFIVANINIPIKFEKNQFKKIIRYDATINNISYSDNKFTWDVFPNNDTNIKGCYYMISVDDIPIISKLTHDNEIIFKPKFNGEFEFLVTPIDHDGFIGITKSFKFVVNDDNLSTIDLSSHEKFSPLYVNNEFNSIFRDIVKMTNFVTLYDITLLHNELSKLPMSILRDLKRDGFKIYITRYNLNILSLKEFKNRVAGLFQPEEKAIYISTYSDFINSCTLHEIGHYVDYDLNNDRYKSSSNKEFIEIFNTERESVKNPHNKSTVREYFAHSFGEFLSNPIKLKEDFPQTFNYMSSLLNEYI